MSLVAGGSPGLRKAFGIVLLLATALIWVAASFISERLVSGSGAADAKSQVPPFFLTYLATTLFTLYIPLTYAKIWLMERAAQRCKMPACCVCWALPVLQLLLLCLGCPATCCLCF